MQDDKSDRDSIWFAAAVLAAGAAVEAYRDGSVLGAIVLLVLAAVLVGLFVTGANLRLTPRTDGRPHPDDDWFREHPWWHPDPEEPTGDTGRGTRQQTGRERRRSSGYDYRTYEDFFGLRAARAKSAYAFSIIEAKALLDIPDGATTDQARAAYRRAVLRAHPDRGGDEEAFLKVQAAWECLQRHSN